MNKVFLGGTCADTTWREALIKMLGVSFFNPVVEDWTEKCQSIEEVEKAENCNIHLYVITKEMLGVFSIAEVIESAHMSSKQTIFHVIPDGFDEGQLRSLKAVGKMVIKHGGVAYVDSDLTRTARVLNVCYGNEGQN